MAASTISVVVATYDGSRHIADQLESLYGQTVEPIEIIISDDGSSDGTVELARRIAAGRGTRTTITRNAVRLGFRDNFLRAALRARGDFIAFCDQDDVWRADKLERCAQFLGDGEVSLITHCATTIDEANAATGVFRQGLRGTRVRPPLSYDPWGTFWGFSILFRRELLHVSPIEDRFRDYIEPSYPIAHDRWISFLGQMLGSTVEIDEPLVGYRQHRANLFGAPRDGRVVPGIDLRGRSLNYIDATLGMLRIVDGIPDEATARFPLFDRGRCLSFIDAALSQLRARDAIYEADRRLEALRICHRAIRDGRYRNAHDGRMRWRSIARDLRFIATRS